ncbi:MAG: hypothetical protein WEE64_01080 [Dehalococcoidia bacterium]
MTLREIAAAYGDAWNETGETKRRARLEKDWADFGARADPQSHVEW